MNGTVMQKQPSSRNRKFQAIFASPNRYFTENSRWVPCSERVEQKRHLNAYGKYDLRPFLTPQKTRLDKKWSKNRTKPLSIMSFRCASGNLLIYQKHGSLIRGTQRQFLENIRICPEDDLRSRIFGTFIVKFLACLPLLGFSNI